MSEPQHHTEPQVLVDFEPAIGLLDYHAHFRDLGPQRIAAEQPVADIAVICIHGAQAIAGIGTAQIFFHFPDHTAAGDDECPMDVARQCNAAFTVFRLHIAQPCQRKKPHREVVKVLSVAVGGLADAQPARTAEYALHIAHQPFGLVQPAALAQFSVKRDVQHHPKGISPEITQAVRPDPLGPHPIELFQHIADVPQHRATSRMDKCRARRPWRAPVLAA